MTGWTPLFQRIVCSSLWDQKDHVRLAWVTMLALSTRDGEVPLKTAAALARMARIDLDKAEDAIKVLSSPDETAPSGDLEGGRRILPGPLGWRIVKWAEYRDLAKAAIKREKNAGYQADFRERHKEDHDEESAESPAAGPKPCPLDPPENLKTQPFMSAWAQWQTFRRGMKACKDWAMLFRKQLEFLSEMGPELATECLNNSIRNGYQGLFDPRKGNGVGAHRANSRASIIAERNQYVSGGDEVRRRLLERDAEERRLEAEGKLAVPFARKPGVASEGAPAG